MNRFFERLRDRLCPKKNQLSKAPGSPEGEPAVPKAPLRPAAVQAVMHTEPPQKSRPAPEETALEAVKQRVERVIESLLGNEALTADLDDEAANVLIEWGSTWARRIAEATAGLNDAAAEADMAPRLRAIQQLMRAVNRWVASRTELSSAEHHQLLTEIGEYASIVSGKSFARPGKEALNNLTALATSQQITSTEFIARLRQWLEQHLSS